MSGVGLGLNAGVVRRFEAGLQETNSTFWSICLLEQKYLFVRIDRTMQKYSLQNKVCPSDCAEAFPVTSMTKSACPQSRAPACRHAVFMASLKTHPTICQNIAFLKSENQIIPLSTEFPLHLALFMNSLIDLSYKYLW